MQIHSHSHGRKSDGLSQDEIEDVLHDTFSVKPDKNVPSVEQILNDEDKKEEPKEEAKEEKKDNQPDFENMSLTE